MLDAGVRTAALAVPESVTLAVHLEDVDMVGEPNEQRAGEALGGEDAGPFVEGKIASDDGGTALVALAEDLEEQLGAGRRQRGIAEFVDDQQLETFMEFSQSID